MTGIESIFSWRCASCGGTFIDCDDREVCLECTTDALVRDCSERLDRFCAELHMAGFRIHRDGLSVRIEMPL